MISSISLPNWQYSRYKKISGEHKAAWLHKKYKTLLRYAARGHMASDRQMQYNKKEYSYRKLTVRWDAAMYNRLRMAAHRMRISLSFMIHLVMLEKDEVDEKSSYHRTDYFSRKTGLIFIEILRYPWYPPRQHLAPA